jgi:hypothetical protein
MNDNRGWPIQDMNSKKLAIFVAFTLCLNASSSDRIPTFSIQAGIQYALHEQTFSAMRGPEIGYYPKGAYANLGFGFSGLHRRLFDRLTIDGMFRGYLPQDYSSTLSEKWYVYTVGLGPTFKKQLRFLKFDVSLFMGGMAQFGYMQITKDKVDSYCFLCGPDAEEEYKAGDKVYYATRTGMTFDAKLARAFALGISEIGPFIALGLHMPLDATDIWYPPLTLADVSGGISVVLRTRKASP